MATFRKKLRFDFILGKVCVNLVDDQNSQAHSESPERGGPLSHNFLEILALKTKDVEIFEKNLESLESPAWNHSLVNSGPSCEALQELLCLGPKDVGSCCDHGAAHVYCVQFLFFNLSPFFKMTIGPYTLED